MTCCQRSGSFKRGSKALKVNLKRNRHANQLCSVRCTLPACQVVFRFSCRDPQSLHRANLKTREASKEREAKLRKAKVGKSPQRSLPSLGKSQSFVQSTSNVQPLSSIMKSFAAVLLLCCLAASAIADTGTACSLSLSASTLSLSVRVVASGVRAVTEQRAMDIQKQAAMNLNPNPSSLNPNLNPNPNVINPEMNGPARSSSAFLAPSSLLPPPSSLLHSDLSHLRIWRVCSCELQSLRAFLRSEAKVSALLSSPLSSLLSPLSSPSVSSVCSLLLRL
jgi:hypothetical protein